MTHYRQQGDVSLFQTVDGGDIAINDGVVGMSSGLGTAVYLSMFGGNESSNAWWGNSLNESIAHQYTSETGFLLKSAPATSNNLRRIEDAAARDLAWLITQEIATSVSVFATIPKINSVQITVNIDLDDPIEFIEKWNTE